MGLFYFFLSPNIVPFFGPLFLWGNCHPRPCGWAVSHMTQQPDHGGGRMRQAEGQMAGGAEAVNGAPFQRHCLPSLLTSPEFSDSGPSQELAVHAGCQYRHWPVTFL